MKTIHALTVLAAAAVAAPALGDSWRAGVVGDFSDGANWADGSAPGLYDPVVISSGSATRSSSATLGRRADTTINGTGTLNLNSAFLPAIGGDTTLTIADEGVLNISYDSSYFFAGRNGRSTIVQTGGRFNAHVKGFTLSEQGAASNSSYTMTGGELYATFGPTEAFYQVGETHKGVHIGRSADDTFTVDGGYASFANSPAANAAARRAYISRGSTFRVASGYASFSDFERFIVGALGANGDESRVVVDGGDLEIHTTGGVVVGGGVEGLLSMTGGTLNITGGGALALGVGPVSGPNGETGYGGPNTSSTSRGTVTQSGGDVVMDGSDLVLGVNHAGHYTMTGGTLSADDILLGDYGADNAGGSLFTFNGGVIALNGDDTGILNEAWFVAAPGTTAVYQPEFDQTLIKIPEPAGAALLGIGGLCIGLRRRKA